MQWKIETEDKPLDCWTRKARKKDEEKEDNDNKKEREKELNWTSEMKYRKYNSKIKKKVKQYGTTQKIDQRGEIEENKEVKQEQWKKMKIERKKKEST